MRDPVTTTVPSSSSAAAPDDASAADAEPALIPVANNIATAAATVMTAVW